MSNTKITLYHADWCGHCKNFLPNWNALTKYFDSHNIKHEDFEDSRDHDVVESAGIQGFPTIRISKNGKEYDYHGDRSVDAIIHELAPQEGGNLNNSKRVYIKYTKLN